MNESSINSVTCIIDTGKVRYDCDVAIPSFSCSCIEDNTHSQSGLAPAKFDKIIYMYFAILRAKHMELVAF